MTSPPQCPPPVNQRFNTNGVMDSTAGAPMGVGMHESLYRFFPPTSETLGGAATIERLSQRISRLYTSSYSLSPPSTVPLSSLHGNRIVTNGISDTHQRVVNNIYDKEGVFCFSKDPSRNSTEGNIVHQHHQQVAEAQDSDANEPTQLLFLVRHGQTDMNAAGRLQGRSVNVSLNAIGRRQADELGLFLRNVPFGAVRASSLRRAHETARRILAHNVSGAEAGSGVKAALEETAETSSRRQGPCSDDGVDVVKADMRPSSQVDMMASDEDEDEGLVVPQDPNLDELSWGELEGKDSAQEPWKGRLAALKASWDEGHSNSSAEGGENLLEVEARSRRALEALLDQGHELNLVVSHGRTIRILLLALVGLPLKQMTSIGKVPNTGLYVFHTRVGPGGTRSYRLLSPEYVDTVALQQKTQNEAVPQQP